MDEIAFIKHPEEWADIRRRVGLCKPNNSIVVIVGSGPNFQNEYDMFVSNNPNLKHDVWAVNAAGTKLPIIHHWSTLHYEHICEWKKERAENGLLIDTIKTHSSLVPDYDLKKGFKNDCADYHWSVPRSMGSGSHAILLAGCMGYKKIVLCGIPLSLDYASFRLSMERIKGSGNFNIRSISGWTRELFGNPTQDWLIENK